MSKLFGGFVGYYLAKVLHPQRPDQAPYTAECEDIIDALAMTPNEANEFKEIWRTASGRLSGAPPKAGHTPLYGAQKRVHYATRDLKKYTREDAEQSPVDQIIRELSEDHRRP